MNKNVVRWSGGLAVLGAGAYFLPFPGSVFCPILLVIAWAWVAFRSNAGPVEGSVGAATPEPENAPVRETVRVEIRETLPEPLSDGLHRYRASLEVLSGLKALVVKDTESAVLRLTEGLFTLVANSKEVSSHIERSLSSITDGDSGLRKTVDNLEEQVRVFESLAAHFTEVKDGLAADIGALTHTVSSINQFSDTLSDLADQTNVLAINASIEAARVGIHGRGFAVIATQVQNLARHSKEISEKMARTVQEVVSNVESSFDRQLRRIREADGLIVHSEQELRRWADHVGPQLNEVGAMIGDSRRLAQVVTEELNEVTVSLQFQDRTKQILDHMGTVLQEASGAVVQASGLGEAPVPPSLRDEAFRTASRHFTVREEWALVPSVKPSSSAAGKAVELF